MTENVCTDRCALCFFRGRSTGTCDYIFVMGIRRPSLPGKDCTVYLSRKEGEEILRKPKWDTEAGRKMWLDGKTDKQIADALGTTDRAVNLYRYRKWIPSLKDIQGIPGKLPATNTVEGQKNESAPGKGGMKKKIPEIAAQPEEICNDNVGGCETIPELATHPGDECNDNKENTFPFSMEMACLDSYTKPVSLDEDDKTELFPPRKISVMDVLAMATEHLRGMSAVCTANALQALLYWHCPEDLIRAKENIDYLLERLEGGGTYEKR